MIATAAGPVPMDCLCMPCAPSEGEGVVVDDLVRPADASLYCPVCQQLFDCPVRISCGHTACRGCYEQHLLHSDDGRPCCPVADCGRPVVSPPEPDRFASRVVEGLECFCPHKATGCPWSGARGQLAAHAKVCSAKESVGAHHLATRVEMAIIDPPPRAPELLEPADAALYCGACGDVFERPVRTPSGHTVCARCLPPEAAAFAEPDRFCERIVNDLACFCPERHGGCVWLGKRGDVRAHTKQACRFTVVACPNPRCNERIPRHELQEHVQECCPPDVDCPWGCGARIEGGHRGLAHHRQTCPCEPRRLLATVQQLRLQQLALTQENQRLRASRARSPGSITGPGHDMDDVETS